MQLFFTVHEPIYPTCGQMPVRAGGGGGPGAGEEEGGGRVADHGAQVQVGVGRGAQRALPVSSLPHACSEARRPESRS